MHSTERGFTVVETLLATVLLVTLGFATLGLARGIVQALSARGSASSGSAHIQTTLVAMRSDAATAFAVFVPTRDVFGHGNVAPAHEFDYYSKAQDGSEAWWAYHYDAASATVRRYDYRPAPNGPTAIGVLDPRSGLIDPHASYQPLTAVRSFAAKTLQANELATGASAFGPLIGSLVARAGAAAIPEPVGFVPSSNIARTDLYGGNTTVEVSLTTDRGSRTFHLSTTALPSGFTIHAAPAIRAFVYRIDVGHRFWFGLAQKTWAQVYEQLQYSYSPAIPASWHVWCDFQVYGAGTNGLALNDPNASYRPDHWDEATAGVFYTTTQGDVSRLNPSAGCSKKIPARDEGPALGAPTLSDRAVH